MLGQTDSMRCINRARALRGSGKVSNYSGKFWVANTEYVEIVDSRYIKLFVLEAGQTDSAMLLQAAGSR